MNKLDIVGLIVAFILTLAMSFTFGYFEYEYGYHDGCYSAGRASIKPVSQSQLLLCEEGALGANCDQ